MAVGGVVTAGQEVTVVAVGDDYTTWQGFKDEATGGACDTVGMWCDAAGGGMS
jgi:hypothetical protein